MNNNLIFKLRQMAIRGLGRMYLPDQKQFVFRVKKSHDGVGTEGISRRYTAIVLIGLSNESDQAVASLAASRSLFDICARLQNDIRDVTNLGDVALSLWAACASGYSNCQDFRDRLVELKPDEKTYPLVELSWALDACSKDSEKLLESLGNRLARRLIQAFNQKSGLFPHVVGDNVQSARSHVSCFADAVYPIHALSNYYKLTGDKSALDAAASCAATICKCQGGEGQWWWHYDYRTGEVIEGYPVYSVHQDSMAPMALFALKNAGGPDFTKEVCKGLDWLEYAPEIKGSLIDEDADLIWRKVARQEPNKLSRYMQAAASRIHPGFRIPGIDKMFPPVLIDYENRPYHLGWILHAWPKYRLK